MATGFITSFLAQNLLLGQEEEQSVCKPVYKPVYPDNTVEQSDKISDPCVGASYQTCETYDRKRR